MACCAGHGRGTPVLCGKFYFFVLSNGFCHGSTTELERISQALARDLQCCLVSSDHNTGHRVRYEVVDAETGKEVPQEDRVKGYKVAKGSYVTLDEDELDEVALESTHTIEIESFVARNDVDELHLDEVLLSRAHG